MARLTFWRRQHPGQRNQAPRTLPGGDKPPKIEARVSLRGSGQADGYPSLLGISETEGKRRQAERH